LKIVVELFVIVIVDSAVDDVTIVLPLRSLRGVGSFNNGLGFGLGLALDCIT
jgi:hypothetical protein